MLRTSGAILLKLLLTLLPTSSPFARVKITAGEYFLGHRSGTGNANVLLAFDGAFDEAV